MVNAVPVLTPEQRAVADQFARFAARFSTTIGFVPRQGDATIERLNSATISLLRLSGKPWGVTNYHVIDALRERTKLEPMVCQLGNAQVDVLERLHSESAKYDLAVVDLSGVDPSNFRDKDSDLPCQFHEPRQWPPVRPNIGQFVAFVGFAASKRIHLGKNHFEFGAVCSGASEVISVQEDVITCQFNIDKCVVSFDRDGKGLEDVAGMSGGPVFIQRTSPGGVDILDFSGVIFEHHSEWDTLRIRPGSLIDGDGRVIA